VEVWRGGVNAWECDEMGHMNVRFYLARASEGLAGLARVLGQPHAAAPHAASTLIVREHHVRFLREARAGAPLHMSAGVVELGEAGATVLFSLTHSLSGEPCAAFLTRLEHASAVEGRAFSWPERARAAAERLRVQVPEHARPRGLTSGPIGAGASMEAADRLVLTCISRGVLGPDDCDVFGRMRPDQFAGRISDGIPVLLAPVREIVAANAPEHPARVGGAVLEYRIVYLASARVGDHFEVRSGFTRFGEKTEQVTHWMLDPVGGGAWAVGQAVVINFDLDARRAIPITAAAHAALQPLVKPGLDG